MNIVEINYYKVLQVPGTYINILYKYKYFHTIKIVIKYLFLLIQVSTLNAKIEEK